MLYRDTETGETITEKQLQAEFSALQAEMPNEYSYTFSEYIKNCTAKNGFLEILK